MAEGSWVEPPFWFVIDVEAVGFFGDAYAVGWVVVDREGREHAAEGVCLANFTKLRGDEAGQKWVRQFGGASDALPVVNDLAQLQLRFVHAWAVWRERGAVMAADVPFPVEARFLSNLAFVVLNFPAPYPLIDVASVRLAACLDPTTRVERLPAELPAHNPICDARQSARLLLEALACAAV